MELEEIKERLRRTDGLSNTLGMDFISTPEPDMCVARMKVDDRNRQPFGFLSGGASLGLTAAPKKVTGNTVSGVMELVFDEAPGTVKLSSTSGSFALGLPAGAAYQLDWSTVSGDCDASGYQAPEGRGAKKIKLTADTVSGGLTIYTK